MTRLRFCLLSLAILVAAPAAAADLPNATGESAGLPILATEPTPAESPWKGLYVGSGVSVFGGSHMKGGVGGEAFAGFDKRFDNNWVLGIKATAGYAPIFAASIAPGFNAAAYGLTDAKVGYDFGRITPYVVAGAGVMRPTRIGGGIGNAADMVNDVFSGPGAVQAIGTLGAGFDYAITNRLSVSLEARVYKNGGAGW